MVLGLMRCDCCADRLAGHNLGEVAGGVHVEDNDRHTVFLGQRRGGQIHHLKAAGKHLVVGYGVELRRRRIFLGVGGIDAVDAGSLEPR